MSRPRLKDLSRGALRKMVRQPMTRFELQDVSSIPGRVVLPPNETWSPLVYVNNRYSVQVSYVETAIGKVIHLWIRRHDGEMPRSWADLQRIKNELINPERAAVEVFPPESELVDSANMAHLWVLPADHILPFRLHP